MEPDKSTAIGFGDPSIHREEYALIPPRYSSTRTGRCVIVPQSYSRDAANKAGDNTATAMKSVVTDPRAYDWEGDMTLNRLLRGQSSTRCTCEDSRATQSSNISEEKARHLTPVS